MSYAEYLAFDEAAETKHEYVNGAVVAMAGGTIEHGRLVANLKLMIGQLARAAGRSVYSSDVRVRVTATNRTTYPDLTVGCGTRHPGRRRPARHHEPHAPGRGPLSTGGSERPRREMGALPTARLAPGLPAGGPEPERVELFARAGSTDVWTFQQAGRGASLELEALGGALPVDAVFAGP